MINRISLIVCTRNRAAQLRTCLSYVRGLEAPCEWELVVVDNGSTDATEAVVREFAATSPFAVSHVREAVAGLSRARNRGLAAATGDALIFTDDDCYPEPDYLRSAAEILMRPHVDYFGGRILLHDPTDIPFTIKTDTEIELIPPHSFLRAGVIHGANMGFRRHLVARIGGFNEALGAGSAVKAGEDTEYIARASAAGFHGGYFPGPTVRHHHGRRLEHLPSLMWGYHLGRGAFCASMMLRKDTASQYLGEWLRSLSWRHPRRGMGELVGGLKYGLAHVRAKTAGRKLIPSMDQGIQ